MENKTVVVKELRLKTEFENYTNLKYVSEGGWGKVYSATRSSDNKTVALKLFGYTSQQPIITVINSEVMLMNSLIGVHGVVQMESLFYDTPEGIVPGKNPLCLQSYPIIVMEMLSGGHLLNKLETSIKSQKIPSESDLAGMFHGVVQALESIHNRRYIHRDLKLENCIFVSRRDQFHIKIIDFGSMIELPYNCSKVIEKGNCVGTPGYFAPETIQCSDPRVLDPREKHEYSYKTDVWQVGCILFTLLCGHPPYFVDESHAYKILEGKFCKGHRWNSLSGAAKDLIQKIFRPNPNDRIGLSEILKHPWLTGGAPTNQLSGEYAQKIRSLALREKLKFVFLSEAGASNKYMVRTESLNTIDSTTSSLNNHPNFHHYYHYPLISNDIESKTIINDNNNTTTTTTTTTINHNNNNTINNNNINIPTLDPNRLPSTSLSLNHNTSLSSINNLSYVSESNPQIERAITTSSTNSSISIGQSDCRRMFELIDTDGNGTISVNELLEGIIGLLTKHQPSDKSISDAELIRNHSTISQYPSMDSIEYQPILKRTRSVCPHVISSIQDIFAMMNHNSHGEIDFEAWTFFYDTILQGTMLIRELEEKEYSFFPPDDELLKKRKYDDDDDDEDQEQEEEEEGNNNNINVNNPENENLQNSSDSKKLKYTEN